MASEIRVNKIANRAGLSTVEYTDTGIIVSGIITCTEISGINALNISGVSTFASPLDINGDIDVDGHTNLDNVNISGMTTTTGNLFLDGGKINVGTGVTIESTTGASATGQATFTGIVTATSFVGSGANLTALNASNISSGTVPTARLGSGTASSSKFLRGDSTFQNISTLFVNLNHGQNFLDDQNLIFGDASDMILIHQSSGAKSRLRNTNDSGSLDIESTLTRFLNKDGSTEKLRIDSSGRLLAGTTDIGYNQFADNLTLADSANCGITLRSGSSNQGNIYFSDGTGTGADTYRGMITYAHADNNMQFATNSVERLRINSAGAVMVGGTLQAGSNGGLNAEVTNSGSETTPLVLINQGTADGSGVILSHRGKDDAGNQEDYNYIRMVADDTGNGSEDGSIRFWTVAGGTLAQRVRIDSNGLNLTPITNAARNAGVSTATGTIIYNSTTSTMQVYQGTKWDTLSNVAFAPTGGNATYTFGSYTVHAFTSNGNFVVNTAGTVDVLVVAGGGGGGATSRSNYNGAWAGGGGAGGVLYTTGVSVTAQTYSIVIGGGGAVGSNGSNSTALGLTAIGGGRGGGTTGSSNWTGGSGGSGGGGLGDQPGPYQGGSGTSGQGNAGGPGTDPGGNPYYEQGGGGGGAGEAGNTDGIAFGGDGRDMSGQFGTTYGENGYFGGGGAGGQGTDNSNTTNEGGVGGGGNSGRGYQNSSLAPEAGAANTGGGGGAGGTGSGTGGAAGGSGIVLIRYLT